NPTPSAILLGFARGFGKTGQALFAKCAKRMEHPAKKEKGAPGSPSAPWRKLEAEPRLQLNRPTAQCIACDTEVRVEAGNRAVRVHRAEPPVDRRSVDVD